MLGLASSSYSNIKEEVLRGEIKHISDKLNKKFSVGQGIKFSRSMYEEHMNKALIGHTTC